MNKTKFLTILIIALIATNLMLVFFSFQHGHGPKHPREAKNIVIKKLHFDDAQVEKYKKLIHWHRSRINKAQHQIMELKGELYQTLPQKQPDSIANEKIMDSIGKIQIEIEHVHYKHFQDIRNLCRQDQLADYDEVIREITAIFRREQR